VEILIFSHRVSAKCVSFYCVAMSLSHNFEIYLPNNTLHNYPNLCRHPKLSFPKADGLLQKDGG